MSGYVGWRFGFGAIFWLSAAFGALFVFFVLLIPPSSIDHEAARGAREIDGVERVSGVRVLFECKPLLTLAAALACFHLGNAAMLPLYGMAVVAAKKGDPSTFVAETIVVAQGVMIFASILTMRLGVYPVQVLDGVGAGLQSVAVPGLSARILDGTGRINVGQGAVLTAQGVGAALSPAMGGWIAQDLGYPATFLVLGCFALASLALWISPGSALRAACALSTSSAVERPSNSRGMKPNGDDRPPPQSVLTPCSGPRARLRRKCMQKPNESPGAPSIKPGVTNMMSPRR